MQGDMERIKLDFRERIEKFAKVSLDNLRF